MNIKQKIKVSEENLEEKQKELKQLQ